MDKIIVWISLFVLAFSCDTSKNIDSIVTREWDKCSGEKVCVINFANLMWFEWDTMCFYSGACSLEDINKDLGFKFEKFVDIGDRVIFLNKGRVVYHKEWCNYSENSREGIIFKTNKDKI